MKVTPLVVWGVDLKFEQLEKAVIADCELMHPNKLA